MINEYVCTDLAAECPLEGAQGVRFSQSTQDRIELSRIEILDERGEKALGKPRGCYVTLSFPGAFSLSDDQHARLCAMLAEQIKQMLGDARTVLVVGLGNRRITADAVGPMTVDRITVTRHLQTLDPSLFQKVGQRSVAAMVPGVLGDTGMESADLVAAAVRTVKPDAVIALDALAARSVDRLCCTVQLSDSGIEPGGGVGNRRMALSHKTLGVPVLALGVPTVVNSATLVRDALEKAGISRYENELRQVLENGRSFFVTPKESDAAANAMADLLALALDMALEAAG